MLLRRPDQIRRQQRSSFSAGSAITRLREPLGRQLGPARLAHQTPSDAELSSRKRLDAWKGCGLPTIPPHLRVLPCRPPPSPRSKKRPGFRNTTLGALVSGARNPTRHTREKILGSGHHHALVGQTEGGQMQEQSLGTKTVDWDSKIRKKRKTGFL